MQKQRVSRREKSSVRELLMIHRTTRLASTEDSRLIELFYISLNTPVSLSCYLLFKSGEYDQLVEKEVSPSDYNDGASFRDDFAAVSFLRKNASLQTTFNKKSAAISAFKEAEEICKGVNCNFRNEQSRSQLTTGDYDVLKKTRRKIAQILGYFDIDQVLNTASWGPGSTLLIKGSEVSASHKFDLECQMTREAYDLFHSVMLKAYPTWEKLKNVTCVVGNKIVTVPKNAKTDRTIAIEPGLNTWIQLGIGRLMRKRLRRAGFNLDSDRKNQHSAFLGSVNGYLATVDFKAASDTISYELVRFLLPPVWFSVLDSARSHYYMLDGVPHLSEKFSTMGNGFTFELESLIFAALGVCLCTESGLDTASVSIFGDDLILPAELVVQLDRLCTYMGFTINTKKSFSSGVFRESCGSYYFNGLDVKPLFLKKRILFTKDLYRFANGIRDLSHRRNLYSGCDVRFRYLWRQICDCVPEPLRVFGPLSSGDATIHCNINTCLEARNRKDGWEGFTFPAFPTVAVDVERDTHGLLLARLLSPSRDLAYKNAVSLRAKTKIIYKKRMFVALWYDFGSWN